MYNIQVKHLGSLANFYEIHVVLSKNVPESYLASLRSSIQVWFYSINHASRPEGRIVHNFTSTIKMIKNTAFR